LKQDGTGKSLAGTEALHRELELLREERERERNQLNGQIDDLRRRLDSEAEERRKLTALLTDQREKQEPEPRRSWWRIGKRG
jgi:anti-sigma factor RsiW